eukprot:1577306-Pleurochrysis_carterae.AAC.1
MRTALSSARVLPKRVLCAARCAMRARARARACARARAYDVRLHLLLASVWQVTDASGSDALQIDTHTLSKLRTDAAGVPIGEGQARTLTQQRRTHRGVRASACVVGRRVLKLRPK